MLQVLQVYDPVVSLQIPLFGAVWVQVWVHRALPLLQHSLIFVQPVKYYFWLRQELKESQCLSVHP